MEDHNVDIVLNQTGFTNRDVIKAMLDECKGDVIKTIMTLSGIKQCPDRCLSKPSEFDSIRQIVDEKENLYFQRKR